MSSLELFLWFLVLIIIVKFFLSILSIVLIQLNWGNVSQKEISLIGLYISTVLSLLLGLVIFYLIYQRQQFTCANGKSFTV